MRKREYDKELALEKINILFNEAEQQFHKNPGLSNRYVDIVRRIIMKLKIRMPREFKRKFCKHCYSYLVPNKNCRVRIHKSRVIYLCNNCKKFMRFVIKKNS